MFIPGALFGRIVMKVANAMSHGAITIALDRSLTEAASMMLKFEISGLPVVDARGKLVGIVTEGDFLRRTEFGNENRERRIEYVSEIGPLAEEYTRSHGRNVSEVMTRNVVTVTEETSIQEVARLMECHHINRVPVLRNEELIGIVSRSNLLHAFIVLSKPAHSALVNDAEIREQIRAELAKHDWTASSTVKVLVTNGIVDLEGTVSDPRQRMAVRVVAGNVPGAKEVRDRLALRRYAGTLRVNS